MALYLVQHGLSLSKQEDPRKGLTDLGRGQTARIARVAAEYGLAVSMIMHSGKLRAQQTADIMAQALKPEEGIHKSSGMGPLDDVASFAESLDMAADRMMVGHLPFMERLIA
jgi:phosphohistidine phosphatase